MPAKAMAMLEVLLLLMGAMVDSVDCSCSECHVLAVFVADGRCMTKEVALCFVAVHASPGHHVTHQKQAMCNVAEVC